MNDKMTRAMCEETRCLPVELFGERRRRAVRNDDSDIRAAWVDVYAERLANGQDLWSGMPLEDARKEASRIRRHVSSNYGRDRKTREDTIRAA